MTLSNFIINRFRYLLGKKEKVALLCHRKPDSDTLGSALSLFLAFEAEKKKITLFVKDKVPRNLWFLPYVERVEKLNRIKRGDFDLAVACDCGDEKQTGLETPGNLKALFPLLINIDHHQDNNHFGDLNIIEPNFSSTAEIIYHLLRALKIKINAPIATCLLAGIVGDTDNFRNPNTNIKTLKITSELLASGVNLKEVSRSLSERRSIVSLKLWGKVLARLKKHQQFGIVSTFVTQKDIIESRCFPEDIKEIINFLNSIPNVNASFLLVEEKSGELKGSFRTLKPEVDVAGLAAFFGGGGHREAAGFSFPGKIVYENQSWLIK